MNFKSSGKLAIAAVWKYIISRKASSRFAKGCLILGGAVIAGPLWLPFLTAAIEASTGIVINEPSPWLGLPIIAFGFFSAVLPELAEIKAKQEGTSRRAEREHEHDSKYANKLRALLPESDFEWMLHIIGDTHTMRETHREKLKDLEVELASKESGFIDVEMQSQAENLRKAISNLLNFSALKFFVPDNPLIKDEFWMFPDGNWDRGCPGPEQEKTYTELTRQLNDLLKKLELARSAFLKCARDKLF